MIFSAAWRDVLFDDHMLNWPLDRNSNNRPWPALRALIDQEVANTNLQANEHTDFLDRFRLALKAGGYLRNGLWYKSQGGWVRLPHRLVLGGSFVTANRDYALAMFHDSATVNRNLVRNSQCVGQEGADHVYNDFIELLRLPIRKVLQSWDSAGQYRARANNYCGSTNSNAITVTIMQAGMHIFSDGFE